MRHNPYNTVKGYILEQADKLWVPEITWFTYNELFRLLEETYEKGFEEALKNEKDRLK